MKIAVFLHLFYTDLIPEIIDYLSNIKEDFDLIVNTTDTVDEKNLAKIKSFAKRFKSSTLLISENKGMDIGGYLNIINHVIENNLEYDLVLFLHTKKHARTDPTLGKKWRRELFNTVLGSEDRVKYILNIFKENEFIGMIGADKHLLYMSEDVFNEEDINYYAERLGLKDIRLEFIGGSIFWTRWKPFKDVFSKSKIETNEFEDNETYKNDGMKAHAIERIFGSIITNSGYEILGVDFEKGTLEPENVVWYQHQNKMLERYIELKCNLGINGNVYPAIDISNSLPYDVFYLFDIILDRQFGLKSKKEVKLKDLCLIKTKADIKYISDFHKEQFENDSLFPAYVRYSEGFKSGEVAPATYLIHPSVFKSITNVSFPNNLYQLDGMRRIMSSIHAGLHQIDAYILIARNCLKNFIPPEVSKNIKELRSKLTWFPDYQEIIEFGLKGERDHSPRYTEIYDFSIMRDQTVVDFGGNTGQAALESYFQGAKKIYNFDCQRAAIEILNIMAKTLGATNIVSEVIDFNKASFKKDVLDIANGWDWAIFQAIYRTKEIKDIESVFDFIVGKTRKGIVFEGHADSKIDTPEFYQNLFKKYNFKEVKYLDHSQGRPAYLLIKNEEWNDWGEEEFVAELEEKPENVIRQLGNIVNLSQLQ